MTSSWVKQWPEKVFITAMMDTLKCLRLRPIGSNTNNQHRLIRCYPSSLPNSGFTKEEVVASSPMSTQLSRLIAKHPAASESARHETQPSIQYWRLNDALPRSGDKRFSLMKR